MSPGTTEGRRQTRLQGLLTQAARRQRVSAVSACAWDFWWILASVFLLLLLVSRLLGIIPPWFSVKTLIAMPAGALLLALVFYKRPARVDAARLLDQRLATKDLFLTASLIDTSLGAYQSLVLDQAEHRAAAVKPSDMPRWRWERRAASAAGSLAALCLAVLYVPQLDPFGRQEQRRQRAQQQESLRETVKATALRAALLEQKAPNVQADQIAQAVAELQKTFNMAKPEEKLLTFNRLNEQQKILGQLWRQANEERLKDAMNRAPTLQSFGLHDPSKVQQWKNDLEKGETASVNKELGELKDLARKLGDTSDSVRQEEMRQELMDRLKGLQDALGQQTNSQPIDAALQRAMEQLQMASLKGLSADALKALTSSLDLTAEELRELAKAMSELKNLEEALKALQSAKRLHGVKPIDGMVCKSCTNCGDYAALFNAQYAACAGGNLYGDAPGVGMGPGLGVGPRPHGDENATTGYHAQQSTSDMQPGKMLLSWKTREVSESGKAREDFRQAVETVRQQAGEAILKEQIPSGYHAAIKTYFDSLQHEPPEPAKP